MSFTKSTGLMTTALLLVLGSSVDGFAQQGANSVGIVRIFDGRPQTAVRTASGQTIQQIGGHPTGYNDGHCPTGNCPPAGPVVHGNCPTGNCPTGGCPTGNCPGGCFQGKFGEYYCKRSPDYGYSPPAKYPLHRRGIEYNHYFPANWYGAGADYSQSQAPMVYQPTDTTQLGYRYQHVPFWQPMPNRLPPRPIPAQWHTTNPAVSASRFSNGNGIGPAGYAGGGQFGGYSGYQNGAYGAANSCPPGVTSTPNMISQPGSRTNSLPPAPSGAGAPASPIPLDDEFDDESGAEPGTLPPIPNSTPIGA